MSKIVNEERARQGRRGTHVFIILIVSLLILAIGWFVVENFFGEAIDGAPTQLETAS